MSESAGEAVEGFAEPRGRLRVGWLWVGFALLLVMGWMVYDVLVPMLAMSHSRTIVREQVYAGAAWSSANQGLREQGFSARFFFRRTATSETVYLLNSGRRTSRTMSAGNYALVGMVGPTHIPYPYNGVYAPRVFVNTSGTVTRVLAD
jgi:hypothetical protein